MPSRSAAGSGWTNCGSQCGAQARSLSAPKSGATWSIGAWAVKENFSCGCARAEPEAASPPCSARAAACRCSAALGSRARATPQVKPKRKRKLLAIVVFPFSTSLSRADSGLLLFELVAVAGAQRQAVDLLEFCDLDNGFLAERRFAFESVQHDAFEKVAQGEIFQFGKRLQDFQQAFFDANSGLNAFNFDHEKQPSLYM